MSINITVDTKEADIYLARLGQDRQLDFVISKVINQLLKIIQDAVRGNMKAKIHFTQWVFESRGIKITKFSKKNDLPGIIGIDDRLSNLVRLESGLDHLPYLGKKYLAVPNAIVFKNKPIRKDNPLALSNLQLHETPGGLKGASETFLAQGTGKAPVIVQRVANVGKGVRPPKGKGPKGTNKGLGTRVLYTLVKSVKTPVKLDFYGIAQALVNELLVTETQKALDYAIKTARK